MQSGEKLAKCKRRIFLFSGFYYQCRQDFIQLLTLHRPYKSARVSSVVVSSLLFKIARGPLLYSVHFGTFTKEYCSTSSLSRAANRLFRDRLSFGWELGGVFLHRVDRNPPNPWLEQQVLYWLRHAHSGVTAYKMHLSSGASRPRARHFICHNARVPVS